MRFSKTKLGLLCLTLWMQAACAESERDLAMATQNPLGRNPKAKYFTLPIIGYVYEGYGTGKNTQDVIEAKPVLPFAFTQNYDFILRPIVPVYHQPSTVAGTAYINGWGDINPTAFIAPALTSRLLWGIGPSIFVPTASNKALGSGKWSIGPQLCLITITDKWQIGFLTSNVWSVAGDASREAVNKFSFQYLVSYNFSNGWYFTTDPTITANWKAASHKQWLVPFGGGVGRAFHYGKQAINFSVEGYYNPIRPEALGPDWNLQAKVEFLWPDNNTQNVI